MKTTTNNNKKKKKKNLHLQKFLKMVDDIDFVVQLDE